MTALLEEVPATLRTRGRIYGIRNVVMERQGGPVHTSFWVAADDWPVMQPRAGRAPRNDLRIQASIPRGETWDLQRGSRLRFEHTVAKGWIRVSASFPVEHAAVTPAPVVHAAVCSGCRKPWPCDGAAV